jgi:DNA-directed RNA polymerase alpha subunit
MIRLWTIRDESIHALELPKQLTTLLQHEGIQTVADLTKLSGEDLLRIPGLGKTWLRHIQRACAVHGIRLRPPSM